MITDQPINDVRWVKIEDVVANDYNPNRVAGPQLHLLYVSIKHDGYTQPIVTVWDKDKKKYVIVDGFHRYFVAKKYKDIYEMVEGKLPVVVLNKDIKDRMASTIRHNRARGRHVISGMTNLVVKLLEEGWSDADICNELGMEPEELVRLKIMSGVTKFLKGKEYSMAWETLQQIRFREKLKSEGEDVFILTEADYENSKEEVK